MHDISPTTGEEFYSGGWQDVYKICSVLNIGSGKLSKISQDVVNYYQEMVDREIDGELEQYYHVPIRPYNQYIQTKGTTEKVFPGTIRTIARYWTAGLLMSSEFQSLDRNANESAQNYINDSKQKIFDLITYSRRIPNQRMKHNLRTMPPNMAPGRNPELNI